VNFQEDMIGCQINFYIIKKDYIFLIMVKILFLSQLILPTTVTIGLNKWFLANKKNPKYL